MHLPFRLVNVFAIEGDPFSGNPLAVFDDPPGGLDTGTMQALARQFNLSESTFLALTSGASGSGEPDATVRLFTPTVELAFAGHPTLGTAYVVGQRARRDALVLRLPVGDIPVRRDELGWTLTANTATVRPAGCDPQALAAMLGLSAADIAGPASWVSTGNEQLLVPLASADAIRRTQPDAALLRDLAMSPQGEAMCHTWAWTSADQVEARFFFSQGTSVVEDPATGSAAANLGGLLAHEGRRDLRITVRQGADVHRPSLLAIGVDGHAVVTVSGRVHEIGSGSVDLDLS
ncbi:MAG: PhzF family phenazine biosynthesis protein [Dermatophilaceae bacterium]